MALANLPKTEIISQKLILKIANHELYVRLFQSGEMLTLIFLLTAAAGMPGRLAVKARQAGKPHCLERE